MIRGYAAEAVRTAEAPALAAGEPLMERAADAVADAVGELLDDVPDPWVLVLVGGGHNGGDGLFAAASLASSAQVTVVLARAEVHAGGLEAAQAAGVDLIDLSDAQPNRSEPPEDGWAALRRVAARADVWVDALAGIGVRGALRGVTGEVVGALLEVADGAPVAPIVVAVDLPSGVDADTGATEGPVLAADLTVAFGASKAGLLLPPGDRLGGAVRTVSLGLSQAFGALPATVSRLTGADARDLWPTPDVDAHKYTRGVVGVVAGSESYPGAAVLCAGAAVRTGVGMVRYLGPERARDLVLQRWPEVVTAPGRVQAWVVGPGIGPDDAARLAEAEQALAAAVREAVGVVVDAGALTLVGREVVRGSRAVLTPHAGELAALLRGLGEPVERAEVERDPRRWAARAAQATGATVLLKGPTTVVVGPDGETFSQADGTAWMATAGSGDVLAGVLGALLAGLPEVPPAAVAALAAFVHGRAGTQASDGGPIGASDLLVALPATIRSILLLPSL